MHLFPITFSIIYSVTSQFTHETSNYDISSFFKDQKIDYIIPESTICSSQGPDILIAVHSSPNNTRNRNSIRSSFGAFRRVNDHSVQVIFIVGMTKNETVDRDLHQESDDYRDIIQSNFIDSYRNLTLKHVALLNWVDIYCGNVSYFVKADDDTLIDVFHLEYFLRTYTLESDFYCKVIYTRVLRVGKWAVTKEEYPNDYYPRYCEGFAYILTNVKKLSRMVDNALGEKFFWIDDVFLLGDIRNKLNMTLQYFPDNFGYSEINLTSTYDSMNFIFFRNGHDKINETLWEKLWNSILTNGFDLYLH